MIAANKYLDLNLSVVNLGGIILKILQVSEIMKYDDLLDRLIFAQGENAKEVFSSTLSFLYLLGKIQYNRELDTIELVR
jgi:hypothetical protein